MIGLKVKREVTDTISVINVMSDLATMADFHCEFIRSLFSIFAFEFQA